MEAPIRESFEAFLVRIGYVPEHMIVHEVGCGVVGPRSPWGHRTNLFAGLFEHVTATDIDREVVNNPPYPNVRYVCANAETFRDGVYNAIILENVFHFVGDRDAALANLMAMLAPGGIIVVTHGGPRSRWAARYSDPAENDAFIARMMGLIIPSLAFLRDHEFTTDYDDDFGSRLFYRA